MKLTFCGFLSERQQKEKTDFESQPTRATGFQALLPTARERINNKMQ